MLAVPTLNWMHYNITFTAISDTIAAYLNTLSLVTGPFKHRCQFPVDRSVNNKNPELNTLQATELWEEEAGMVGVKRPQLLQNLSVQPEAAVIIQCWGLSWLSPETHRRGSRAICTGPLQESYYSHHSMGCVTIVLLVSWWTGVTSYRLSTLESIESWDTSQIDRILMIHKLTSLFDIKTTKCKIDDKNGVYGVLKSLTATHMYKN